MSSIPWSYSAQYEDNLDEVLRKVQQREFNAGRYGDAIFSSLRHMPIDDNTNAPAPGARHASIEEARESTDQPDEGTRSILDMLGYSDEPEPFYFAPFDKEQLFGIFETDRPTAEQVFADGSELLDQIDRGFGRYLIVYQGDQPSQVMFFGYTAD